METYHEIINFNWDFTNNIKIVEIKNPQLLTRLLFYRVTNDLGYEYGGLVKKSFVTNTKYELPIKIELVKDKVILSHKLKDIKNFTNCLCWIEVERFFEKQ